jgi:transcriptional regulator of NAD metabolism
VKNATIKRAKKVVLIIIYKPLNIMETKWKQMETFWKQITTNHIGVIFAIKYLVIGLDYGNIKKNALQMTIMTINLLLLIRKWL